MKITVAGVGYVGLSLAVLLAQNHEVTAITTTEAKAEKLNKFISPIQDDEIERFFDEVKAQYFAQDEAFCERSWGMSHDYRIAVECGSTMVRVGTAIFGPRIY